MSHPFGFRAFLVLLAAIFSSVAGRSAAAEGSPASLIFAPGEEPHWMGRLITALRAGVHPGRQIEERILFRSEGEPSYLAVRWMRWPGEFNDRRFELYSVHRQPQGETTLQLEYVGVQYWIDMIGPTGLDIHHDGIPLIFLRSWVGGNFFLNEGLHIFRLSRPWAEITPFGQPERVRLPDRHDYYRPELMAYDIRWAWMFDICSACDIYIPIPLAWAGSQYAPACDQYPGLFDDVISKNILDRRQYGFDDVGIFLERTAEIALLQAQSGRAEEAMKTLRDGLAEARSQAPSHVRIEKQPFTEVEMELKLRHIEESLAPVLESAAAASTLACPLLGYEGRGDHSSLFHL
jgi:hypothetical protein